MPEQHLQLAAAHSTQTLSYFGALGADGALRGASVAVVVGLLLDARKAYVSLLKNDESDACVGTGLDGVTVAECARAAGLAAVSRSDGVQAYHAIATAEPVRRAADCALTALGRLAAPARSKLAATEASAR